MPRIKIHDLLEKIIRLLSEPDISDEHEMPEHQDTCKMFKNDRIAFNEKAREYTRAHAVPI